MEQTMIAAQPQSKVFYKVAGVMAILIVLAGVTDVITSMGAAAQDNRAAIITDWFTLFQTSRFEAFSRLGLINIFTITLSIPIYLAFTQVFRQQRAAWAALASILFFIGAAVYLSSNTVFAMFAVSRQAATAPVAQKAAMEAAAGVLLAQGADLTSGTFMGLFITQVAGLLVSGAMLRESCFGKWIGVPGLAGYGLMVVFFILTAFFPAYFDIAIVISMPGGLILMSYEILLARKFFQLGR